MISSPKDGGNSRTYCHLELLVVSVGFRSIYSFVHFLGLLIPERKVSLPADVVLSDRDYNEELGQAVSLSAGN